MSSEAARRLLEGASRRVRQHVQILSALIAGQVEHALGLAFEHIAEFGSDPLVRTPWRARYATDSTLGSRWSCAPCG
jgi:DNA-binding GntR family transcriptional regulator